MVWKNYFLKSNNNSATFNSGHDTKSGLLPTLFYIIYIHPISQVMGFLPVSTITKNHTCITCSFPGILPESKKSHGIMVGFSLLTEILQNFHGIICSIEQNFPQISQMGEKVPWNDRWEKIFHFSTNWENLIYFG